MANIYDIRRYGTFAFMAVAILLAACFLAVSNSIVGDLASQERQRMELWAEATKSIIGTSAEDAGNEAQSQQYINFLLHIIEDNRSIPVILADDKGDIILHRNFDLPEPLDSLNPLYISERNAEFLSKKLKSLASQKQNIIPIEIGDGITQHLYYQDSRLLQRLNYFPYVQMLIMVVFVSVVYFAVMSTKKAEQNKVWVGLQSAVSYMKTRISQRIKLAYVLPPAEELPLKAQLSDSLFQWVLENLIKNAVDAMDADGAITVVAGRDERAGRIFIEVTDTGKGLPKKRFKTIFKPGYTTKKRGWGLGLALAKRIVEQYHGGRIFVKWSEPDRGTTFRIELPSL